jgi:hypothetical protein
MYPILPQQTRDAVGRLSILYRMTAQLLFGLANPPKEQLRRRRSTCKALFGPRWFEQSRQLYMRAQLLFLNEMSLRKNTIQCSGNGHAPAFKKR